MSRPRARIAVAGALALLAILALVALGNWQVRRLGWKRALIAQVEARVHAAPVSPPSPTTWPRVTAADWQYRRIRLTGSFVGSAQTLVQAASELGAGWWVLTPLRTAEAGTVLVNRGFVSRRRAPPPPPGPVSLTGLVRISEPGGAFLRHNDPAADRWYSRDVAAIARARHLPNVAPYFVDADAAPARRGEPVGGLTVVRFPNNHLAYAITWYSLAVMVAGAFLVLLRVERRRSPPR